MQRAAARQLAKAHKRLEVTLWQATNGPNTEQRENFAVASDLVRIPTAALERAAPELGVLAVHEGLAPMPGSSRPDGTTPADPSPAPDDRVRT